jgi:hypothetical protein
MQIGILWTFYKDHSSQQLVHSCSAKRLSAFSQLYFTVGFSQLITHSSFSHSHSSTKHTLSVVLQRYILWVITIYITVPLMGSFTDKMFF